MSDVAKNRAAGLKPYGSVQPILKGGFGPRVFHDLAGTQRWGLLLPPTNGPAPGRAVRKAKGMPAEPAGKKTKKFAVEDRPYRHRV